MSAAHLQQYLVNQVNSASPEELLVMLYNGAIRFLTEAEVAMEEGQVAQQGMLIGRAIDIVNELSATLDHGIGGQIAANLEALYAYMTRELLQANLKDDHKRLQVVREMLLDLRDTWLQAIEQVHVQRASEDKGVRAKSGAGSVPSQHSTALQGY